MSMIKILVHGKIENSLAIIKKQTILDKIKVLLKNIFNRK